MGAYIIFDIEFEAMKDRRKFEKMYKHQVLIDEDTEDGLAWRFMRNPDLNLIYFIGFLGYAEPQMILDECKKKGIKIKFLAWIPINDRQAEWNKIKGRW